MASRPPSRARGVRLCYGDVYASWWQITFCVVLVALLVITTVDLLTTGYLLTWTEAFLAWLHDENLAIVVVFFILFGALSIVLLLPQTVLFVGAGFLCDSRLHHRVAAFFCGMALSIVTFAIGATVAFQLARSVLPPSCTRRCFRHFAILNGLDHALRHKGRRMNMLLRINPLAPYNAINYGLGLSSCTLSDYCQGLVGSLPYMSVAVYAGTIITTVAEVDSMFTHTSAAWICVYCALGVFCIVSAIALVRYTAAEMEAAVSLSRRMTEDGYSCSGELERTGHQSTIFGTFVARDSAADGDEEMATIGDGSGMVRQPLLTTDDRRAVQLSERARTVESSSAVDL